MRRHKLTTAIALASTSLLLTACSSTGLFSGSEGSFWGSSDNNDAHQQGGGRYYHRPVVVNPGYHLEGRNSPVTHKERDAQWINRQSPEDFTIEVGTAEKPSTVSKALHNSPKTQRAAQYKYNNGGKTYYGGAYGTYKSREEAEKAMQNLPESVRANAKIKHWNSIQPKVQEPVSSESKPTFSRPAPAAVADDTGSDAE